MGPGRSARFNAWAETLTDHPEATPQVLDAFHQNLYGPGFVYSADRAFVATCRTPCLVLAGNDEAHPFAISEEVAKLLPSAEFVPEWKEGAALAARQDPGQGVPGEAHAPVLSIAQARRGAMASASGAR